MAQARVARLRGGRGRGGGGVGRGPGGTQQAAARGATGAAAASGAFARPAACVPRQRAWDLGSSRALGARGSPRRGAVRRRPRPPNPTRGTGGTPLPARGSTRARRCCAPRRVDTLRVRAPAPGRAGGRARGPRRRRRRRGRRPRFDHSRAAPRARALRPPVAARTTSRPGASLGLEAAPPERAGPAQPLITAFGSPAPAEAQGIGRRLVMVGPVSGRGPPRAGGPAGAGRPRLPRR